MFKKTTASKDKVKLLVGLTGPSGSGKTYSALQLAYGITGDWSKITLVDTENKSALYYSGADKTGAWDHIHFPFDHESMIQGRKIIGFHPWNWIEVIKTAESDPKTEVLILDSISHAWQGVRDLAATAKTKWMEATPAHEAFVNKMRDTHLHVIATIRSKESMLNYEPNDKGKIVPKKVGIKVLQKEDIEYEFGIVFDIDSDHLAIVNKDRTGLFTSRGHFKIDKDIGKEIIGWAKSETPMTDEQIAKMIQSFARIVLKEDKGITEVSQAEVEEFLEKPLKDCTRGELAQLYLEIANNKLTKEDMRYMIEDRKAAKGGIDDPFKN